MDWNTTLFYRMDTYILFTNYLFSIIKLSNNYHLLPGFLSAFSLSLLLAWPLCLFEELFFCVLLLSLLLSLLACLSTKNSLSTTLGVFFFTTVNASVIFRFCPLVFGSSLVLSSFSFKGK